MSDRATEERVRHADTLWVVYHDFAGLARGKVVPQERVRAVLDEGVSFALANWDFTIDNRQVPDPGYGADSGDFRVIPDPSTAVDIPDSDGVVQVLGNLQLDGKPWDGDPRARVSRQVDRLSAYGIRATVAFEAEFALAGVAEDDWQPLFDGPMFTMEPVAARWAMFGAMLADLEAMDVHVHQFAKEYGPAQFELSLLPADPVTAVDRFLVARAAIKARIAKSGPIATFMPKPWSDKPGNGLHVHVGLTDADGRTVAGDPSDRTRLSDVARHAVGGLLKHAAGQVALASSTPNSSKRLIPGSWAPAHAAWGYGNRAALVRVPGFGDARRMEFRAGDSSCNPYLHVAGLLGSIVDGLDHELEPGNPVDADIGHWSDERASLAGIRRLPADLPSALEALASDEVLTDVLGPSISEHFQKVKRLEWDAYESEAGPHDVNTVSPYERRTYLVPL